MTTLLDHLDSRPIPAVTDTTTITPAQRLRTTMAAARVSFMWFGVQKTLTREQKARAAEAFDAEGQFLSAGKKLIDTRHSAFRAVTAIRGKVDAYWKGQSLPFPEPGVRLIRHDVRRVVRSPDGRLPDRARRRRGQPRPPLLRAQAGRPRPARQPLQSVRLPRDPRRPLRGRVGLPLGRAARLPRRALAGAVRGRAARVSARFEEAVQLAEQAFLDEFARLVSHLTGRISGVGEDGQPRVFRDSAVGNLHEFFDRFRSLNGRSNDQLDALVAEAQRAVRGVGAQDLRDGPGLRQAVATQLSRVQSSLDAMLIERPRRRILRQSAGPGGGVMDLVVAPDGQVRTIYSEEFPLENLGRPRIVRASVVEPDDEGRWHADLRPLLGPVLGPFDRRSEALAAEVAWLEEHWLLPRP